MGEKLPGITALHKRNGYSGYRNLLKRGIQAGIAVYLVEIGDRNIVVRAFVFDQICLPEYGGDVLFDGNVFCLFWVRCQAL